VADETRKLNVFISYSRDDLEFADVVDAALRLGGFATTLDRHGISPGEDWKKRLGALIRDSDTVVFVTSPLSAKSEICAWEVKEAIRLGKRIVPVLSRALGDAKPPPELADLDYIFCYAEPKRPGSGFGPGLVSLSEALNTDLDWLREHTRYLQRAIEWDAGARAVNRLLSGPDIEAAKSWASSRPKNAPEPTELQRDFIKASETEEARQRSAEAQRLKEIEQAQADRGKALAEREEAQKREAGAQKREVEAQKRFTRVATLGSVVAIALAAAATWQYLDARAQREIALQQRDAANQARVDAQDNAAQAKASADRAEANLREAKIAQEAADVAKKAALEQRDRALISESKALSTLADLKGQNGDMTTAALLALEGLPSPGVADRPYTPEPEAALYAALYELRERAAAPVGDPQSTTINVVDGGRLIDLRGAIALGKRDVSAASKRRVRPGPDPDQLVLFDTSKGEAESDETILANLGKYPADSEWGSTGATFSPDGSLLLAMGEKGIVWNALTGVRIAELQDYSPTAAAFSANNKVLATIQTFEATNVEIWNPLTGKRVKSFPAGHADNITDIALSPDGKTLVTCALDQSCRVWTLPTATLVTSLERLGNGTDPMFSPDGSLFLVGARPISVWDAKTWQRVTSLGLDGTDINAAMITSDGALLVTHDEKKTITQVWDLRFSGSPGAVQTLKQADGAPLSAWPSGLRVANEDTLELSLSDHAGGTEGARFSAKTGEYLGPTSKIDCGDVTAAADNCNPFGDGIDDVAPFFNGLDELEGSGYSTQAPGQLSIDAEITGKDATSTKVKANLSLGSTKPDDVQRVLVDPQRNIVAVDVVGNRLLLGALDGDRFASETYLGEDTFGWFLLPRRDRLALVGQRKLTIADLKGQQIARFDGKSALIGAGVTLINYNPDFSKIMVHSGNRTRIFRLYPDYQSLSEGARNALPRCLTVEQREAYGLSREPPDWCVEKGKWPFGAPEWKTWLSRKKEDPAAPMPAQEPVR
jgi:WD40 repeat protein